MKNIPSLSKTPLEPLTGQGPERMSGRKGNSALISH